MATAHYEVGLATPADLAGLVTLLGLLFGAEHEFEPDPERQARGLGLVLERPATGEVMVARDGSGVIGMVCLLYTVSTALGTRVALLEDMVVAPEARGRGVGSALLESALAHARATGCARVTLLTDAGNTGARRFYERHGFTRSTMAAFRWHAAAD